jgi:hypothetical protein
MTDKGIKILIACEESDISKRNAVIEGLSIR